jgi:hypothetical protein
MVKLKHRALQFAHNVGLISTNTYLGQCTKLIGNAPDALKLSLAQQAILDGQAAFQANKLTADDMLRNQVNALSLMAENDRLPLAKQAIADGQAAYYEAGSLAPNDMHRRRAQVIGLTPRSDQPALAHEAAIGDTEIALKIWGTGQASASAQTGLMKAGDTGAVLSARPSKPSP